MPKPVSSSGTSTEMHSIHSHNMEEDRQSFVAKSRGVLPESLKHIAIIMDGNGRWAMKQGLSRSEGHKAGTKTFSTIVKESVEIGLQYLTVYAFSKENWKRSELEVQALFSLLVTFIKEHIATLLQYDIRLRFIGDIESLPKGVRSTIDYATKKTKKAKGLQCIIAFNYSARDEIQKACMAVARNICDDIVHSVMHNKTYSRVDYTIQELCKDIENSIEGHTNIDTESFRQYLYTKDIPDPDLIIRTGNEYRMSNFLLFQCAYSELYFSPLLWPEFSPKALHDAIEEFSSRTRRFGA